MTVVESLKQRIENLERELAFMRNHPHDELAPGLANSPRRMFLAATYDNGSYPSNPSTVYPFRFLDGSFTETAGNQTISTTAHTATNPRVAYSIGSDYLAAGTLGAAFRQNNKWWFLPTGGSAMTPSGTATKWQYFGSIDTFYYTSTSTPQASLALYGGNSETNIGLIEWDTKAGTSAGDPDNFGAGNADLLRQTTGHSAATTGNLVYQETGTYAIFLNLYWFHYRISSGATFPSPPETTVLRVEIRRGSSTPAYTSTVTLADQVILTDASVFTSTNLASDLGLYVNGYRNTGYLNGISGTDDRFTASFSLGYEITDLGFLVQNAEMLVVQLPP